MRGLKIDHPIQVWTTDIPLPSHAAGVYVPGGYHGLVQLVRDRLAAFKYLGWLLLPGYNVDCAATREPGDFNIDQGSQFTANGFVSELEEAGEYGRMWQSF